MKLSHFNENYVYLFKEEVLFPSFTLKLMLLFIIMNMSNYRVYIMKENAFAPGGIVSAPAEYAVTQGRSSAPIATRQRLLEGVCAHHVPSAPCRL
jgi:hypothetical protein